MQSVCDLVRSLTAPSPLPVDFPIFAYFGLTGVSSWKISYFQGEKRKETMYSIPEDQKIFSPLLCQLNYLGTAVSLLHSIGF
jgi:hypothetical protein